MKPLHQEARFLAPLIKSIKEASGFEDKVKDIAHGEMQ